MIVNVLPVIKGVDPAWTAKPASEDTVIKPAIISHLGEVAIFVPSETEQVYCGEESWKVKPDVKEKVI